MSHVRKRLFKYYDLVMALFVTILLCSNVIGAAKVCTVWGITFGAGVLFFPISYIFNDVLTEVYGYARARKVVWAGFGAIVFASFMKPFDDSHTAQGLRQAACNFRVDLASFAEDRPDRLKSPLQNGPKNQNERQGC